MREYKFRAWDKQNKKMFPVDWISFQKTAVGFIWDYGNMVRPKREKVKGFDEIKLMQYTGLKDKNGKEIYEGDILFDSFLDEKAIVSWDKAGCWKIGKVYACNYSADGADEVIGNVYENPELLKEGI